MSEHVEFVCPVCATRFAVLAAVWLDPDRVLLCPCCGVTGMAPAGPPPGEGRPMTERAA